jgi:hypothetical protein
MREVVFSKKKSKAIPRTQTATTIVSPLKDKGISNFCTRKHPPDLWHCRCCYFGVFSSKKYKMQNANYFGRMECKISKFQGYI